MEMQMTVGNLIAKLQQNYSADDLCVASLWFDEDFLSKACGEPLTQDEIHAAMRIVHNYDPDEGINWSVIEDAVDTVFEKRNGKESSMQQETTEQVKRG